MATPDRDNLYTTDGSRTVYTRESNGTGWFVGIIVALALLAIGYLVFSANSGPSTTVDINGAPAAIESTDPALAPVETAPTTEAAPATEVPATDAAPAADTAAPAAEAAPATDGAAAPVEEPVVQ